MFDMIAAMAKFEVPTRPPVC